MIRWYSQMVRWCGQMVWSDGQMWSDAYVIIRCSVRCLVKYRSDGQMLMVRWSDANGQMVRWYSQMVRWFWTP